MSIVGNLMGVLTKVGTIASVLAALLAVAALIVRHRSSGGDVRQQTRWLAFVGVACLVLFALSFLTTVVFGDQSAISGAMFLTMFFTVLFAVPIACGIAILQYRLYDLDVVVRKTVLYGVLSGLLLLVFVAVTGSRRCSSRPSEGRLDLVAGIAIGVLVWPLRRVALASPTGSSTAAARRRTRC